MQDFIFHNPVKVYFGKGVAARIGEEAARYGKKALLVYGGGSVKANGAYDAVVNSLKARNIATLDHGGVKPNPVLSHVEEGIKKARAEGVDMVIAIGGGSTIDESKAIVAGVKYKGPVWDLYCGKAAVGQAIPLLTVTTLAGTASEMNMGSVITNEATLEKYSAMGEAMFPKASFLDPQYAYTLPAKQTAAGATDAVSHMFEAYFTASDRELDIQRGNIENLTKVLFRRAAELLRDPKNYHARADMTWASTLGLNGMISAGMGDDVCFINHAIEHSLSAIYDITHGAGLAIVMPAWLSYRIDKGETALPARFGRNVFGLAEADDAKCARMAVVKLKETLAAICMPVTLKEAGIPASDIGKIAENATRTCRLWQMPEYDAPAITDILKRAA